MENVFLTSLTTPEVRQLFRQELETYFEKHNQYPISKEEDQQFTISELAAYLKCTKATIHAYKKRGVFPYYQTGRKVYFKRQEIDKTLEVSNKKGHSR